jgi:hypothetical protein
MEVPMHRENLSEDEMRQGVTGHKVRYVLIFGTALAIFALVVAFKAHF